MRPQGARALRGRVPCVGAEEVCSEPPLYIIAASRSCIPHTLPGAHELNTRMPPHPPEFWGSAAALLFVLQWQNWFFSVFKRVLIRGYARV